MSFFDDASLAFLPSSGAGKDGKAYSIKPTTGAGDFTFSRGSNLSATRVGPTGLIEKGRGNLLLQSNQFDTTWTTTSSITLTSGQSGYDGSSDAWLLERTSTGGQRVAQTISNSGVQTYSVYAKANVGDWLYMRCNTSGSPVEAYFDLANGVLGAYGSTTRIDAKIQAVGNGWYRCSMSFNSTIVEARLYPVDGNGSVVGTNESIYIQDAQLEQGLVATEYIESGASEGKAGILEDSPRFDYSGGASCPSLLLEPSRTNLLEYSEYFEGSGWTIQSGVTLTTNTTETLSPEGLYNATKAVGDGTNGIFNNASSSGSHARSVYLKSVSGTINIRISDPYAGGLAQIKSVTTEWQRFDMIGDTGGSNCGIFIDDIPSSGVYIWGAQLEEGSYSTSYIPNHSGGSVTREADVCEGAGTSSTFNDSEGVLYAEIEALGNENTQRWLSISDGSNNNTIQLGFLNSANNYKIAGTIRLGGSFQAFLAYDLGAVAPTFKKCAIKYKRNDFALWVDGVEVATDTSGSAFPLNTLNSLSFTRGDSVQPLQGNVKQVLTFNTALSDAELTALTS